LNTKKNITFIGAGNVATHLAKAFFNKGFSISKVYSKNIENARLLAQTTNAKPCNNLDKLYEQNHIYFVCVKDNVIADIVAQFKAKDSLIVHTSGSISMDIFRQENYTNYGIFYPLQTFSKTKATEINKVPFCIEANTEDNETTLIDLAKMLSDNVQLVNSEQRKQLHLAAVFACNFSNYMYAIADELLTKNNLSLDLLKPLITETANKIQNNAPQLMQTGPAIRNDNAVIEAHLKKLSEHPSYEKIYQILTDGIQNKG